MNIDNGMGTRPADKIYSQKQAQVPMSAQDLSRTKWNTGLMGAIMPIDVLKVIPNQTIKIDLTPNVEMRNPFREAFKGSFRSYFHVYYMQNRYMWERWQNHIDRGEGGNQTIETPKLYYMCNQSGHDQAVTLGAVSNKAGWWTSLTPMSPADYMGVPCEAVQTTYNYNSVATDVRTLDCFKMAIAGSNGTYEESVKRWTPIITSDDTMLKISALPFVMYNRVCRDYYFNKQLLKDNKWWYPDNPKDFILPFDCTKTTADGNASNNYVNCVNRDRPLLESEYVAVYNTDKGYGGGTIEARYVPTNSPADNPQGDAPILNALHFRQYKGDMFQSGSIYSDLMASTDIPTMDEMSLDFTDAITTTVITDSAANRVLKSGQLLGMNSTGEAAYLKSALNKGKAVSNVTMQALASLESWTRWRNRLARVTDNNFYNGTIKSNFGIDPQDDDSTPVYIGGGYIDVGTTTVYNTGGAKDLSGNDLLLGQKGATGSGNGVISIPKFTCKDYGYIMIIQTIVPQVNYVGGLERHWTEILPNDEYYPDLNGLAPQATLKKEIYFTAKSGQNDVFNYVPRYEHMKHRNNLVGGLAEFEDEFIADATRFMKRRFKLSSSNPVFNNYWATMHPGNVDMTPFASTTEPQFDLQCGIHVDSVAPIPIEVEPPESA